MNNSCPRASGELVGPWGGRGSRSPKGRGRTSSSYLLKAGLTCRDNCGWRWRSRARSWAATWIPSLDNPSFDPDFPQEPDFETGRPDFQLDSLTGPSALSIASQDLLRARLCNRGDRSGATEVSFFLTRDIIIDSRDERLATTTRTTVLAGSCREVSARVSLPNMLEGSYTLAARADADERVFEDREDQQPADGGHPWVDLTPPPTPFLSWVLDSGAGQMPRLTARSEANATVRGLSGRNLLRHARGELEPPARAPTCEVPMDMSTYPSSSYSARAYD